MDLKTKQNSEEPFLKIDTIWSEAEENFESIAIKEEIVSDIEPEFNDDNDAPLNEGKYEENTTSNPIPAPWFSLEKRMKNKNQGNESELPNDSKLNCLHELKSFKMVNRRLRCGDCRSLVCPECFKIMHSTLPNHFMGLDTSNSSIYLCRFCSFPFQSVCALQAHVRIHTMETPYVCPDCGLIYSNAYFLILHLINKCFHVYKTVSYKCKGCPDVYFTCDTFSKHIQDSHIESIFRCSYCSLLFNTSNEFSQHMDSNHQKQKIQYLNYFRCTLCSGLVITNTMYQKHLELHYENSESYEVEYHCLCGNVFNLVGAFRSHIQFCDKKGTLPPGWGFLQKNLKTQDLIGVPMDNFYQKKGDSINEGLCSFLNVSHDLKSTLNVDAEDKIIGAEQSLGNRVTKRQNSNETHINKNDEKQLCENYIQHSEDLKDSRCISGMTNNSSKACDEVCNENLSIKNGKSPIDMNLNQAESPETSSAFDVKERMDHCEEVGRNVQEAKDTEADSSKVFYDYIPCDHLGYVKAQGPELNNKGVTYCEEKTEHTACTTSNFHLVTELDEKTGLLVSKKVPKTISTGEDQETGDNFADRENSDKNEDPLNEDVSSKNSTGEKGKPKCGNSFFICPFCIVMFPKHSSTFQQFRLHLEYYHSDAALNITVNNGSLVQKEWEQSAGKGQSGNEENKSPGKSGLSKSEEGANGSKKSLYKKRKCTQLDVVNVESEEYALGNSREIKDVDEYGEAESAEDKTYDEEEKENLTNQNVKKPHSRSDGFWTVNLSVKSTDDLTDVQRETESMRKGTFEGADKPEDLCPVQCIKKESEYEPNENNSQSLKETGIVRTEEIKNKEKKTIYGSKRLLGLPESGKNLQDEFKFDCLELQMGRESARIGSDSGKRQKALESGSRANTSGESKNFDFDEDWDNSKDSSWSNTSEFDLKDGRVESTYYPSLRSRHVEKSRRESEVWSELYESLQLAEKLKKSRKTKQANSTDTKTKCSTLSDYSAKRVVKKPKRYRESSESDYSLEDVENSDSEADFQIIGQGSGQGEATVEADDGDATDATQQQNKKEKLLSKLKNIDQKFVDYLFDLITRKEKCINLYKKHSSLRANRYCQDLRSYRKKVLNGIKLRGRPLKLMRYQELAKKNLSTTEKPEVIECQSNQKKNSDLPFLPSGKSNERKRGRPRKVIDTAKLKERRRSDKEVDFIEKHFDREEAGSSPSKRKRKLSSKLQYYKKMGLPEEKDDFSSGQLIANKTPADSNKKFSCAVCRENFQESKEFRDHISTHRLEENTYQCLECGECFVVRPSLEKHLVAFHKIKNTERYIAENECCTPKREPPEPEVETLKENQCKVCKDQFERAIDLTKHFRIHGMAFLKEFKKEGKAKV